MAMDTAMAMDTVMGKRTNRLNSMLLNFSMTGHGQSRRMTVWARMALMFFCALIAYWAAANAVVNVTKRKNPDTALSINPSDPVALTLRADLQFLAGQDTASLEKVDYAVRKALGAQTLNATALRILAYVADMRGDGARAQDLVAASTQLSRRDFGAQLWLIEAAVRKDHTKTALGHYDIAMRTNYDARTVLFPTLAGALVRQDVREALVPYVKASPQWLPGFLHEAIGAADSPADVANLIMLSGGLPATISRGNLADYLLSQLAGKDQLGTFKQYYESLPNSNASALQSVAFDKNTVGTSYPTAGWQLFEDVGVGGKFVSVANTGSNVLMAFANSGQRNIVTRKLLFLPTGRYRINVSHKSDSSPSNAEATWDIQCLLANSGTKLLWSETVPVSRGGFSVIGAFSVDSSCDAEMINLNVAGGSDQLGTEFSVEKVSISSDR